MRALVRALMLIVPILVLASPSEAGKKKPRAARLSDPELFRRLDAAPRIGIWRLQGEWFSACDSFRTDSPIDCFTRGAEVKKRSPEAMTRLLTLLAKCTWVRSKAWISPACPTLGVKIGGDSLDASLLISLRALKATLSLPGQGSIGTSVPEGAYRDLLRYLWNIDPTHPEIWDPMQKELIARGLNPSVEPPEDLDGILPLGVARDGTLVPYDEPPILVSQVQPAYPEMAREAKIQGRVQLHVLVGIDGRVQSVKVAKGVNYLNDAAKDAVSKWVYKPALLNGGPVAAWVEVPVDFHF